MLYVCFEAKVLYGGLFITKDLTSNSASPFLTLNSTLHPIFKGEGTKISLSSKSFQIKHFNTNFRLVQITLILLQDYIKIKSRPLQNCIRLCAKTTSRLHQDIFRISSRLWGIFEDYFKNNKTTLRLILD